MTGFLRHENQGFLPNNRSGEQTHRRPVKNHGSGASQLSLWMATFLIATGVACTQPRNSQDLKERTADATANMKRDAKAVAAGIKEGWSRDKPLDVNSASKEDLMTLPGINSADADKIIAARPYDSPNDLLSRRILPKAKFDQIADRVKAKR